MSTQPITLDFSKSQAMAANPVQLDFSKAEHMDEQPDQGGPAARFLTRFTGLPVHDIAEHPSAYLNPFSKQYWDKGEEEQAAKKAAPPPTAGDFIPGRQTYQDIKDKNYAGAAGNVAGFAAQVAPLLFGGSQEIAPGETPPLGPKAVATAPVRMAARTAEAALNSKFASGMKAMTPADEAVASPFKVPGRDFGLPKRGAASFDPAASPSRNLPGSIGKEVIGPWPKPAEPIPARQGLQLNGYVAPEAKWTLPSQESSVLGPRTAAPRTPGAPLEHGFDMRPAEDLGNAVRESTQKSQGALPRGERRIVERTPQEQQTQALFGQARRELGEDATSDQIMARAEQLKRPAQSWTPPRAQTQWPPVGSAQDLFETQGIQENIRNQADSEMDALRKRGNEEGYARNTRLGKSKGELTGTAAKPVKLTKTPGVKASGTAYPSVTSEEDLIPLLKRSIELAKKAKKAKKK